MYTLDTIELNLNQQPLTINKTQKYCKWCGNKLSMYNLTGFCFCHQPKKYEYEDILQAKKLERQRQKYEMNRNKNK